MPDLLEGRAAVAHLLRRAGFGPDVQTWPAWRDLSFEGALARLLAGLDGSVPDDPPGFDPYVPGAIQQLWLERMRAGANDLAEKLTLFWHGHFATSDAKLQDPLLLWRQHRMLRALGAGAFGDLVLGVSRDVAMIRWLDGNANRKGHPNENYARELQELFTLGIGHYSEQDIREVARAFTGWHSLHHEFVFQAHFHDAGEKTIHGQAGSFDGADVVRILVEHPACPRFLARKLLRFFSHPDPTDAEVDALAATMRAAGMSVKATLEALFSAPAFRDPSRARTLVASPAEFVVAALRVSGVREVPRFVSGAMDRMGQILFRPPSVKGWTSGPGWLSSGAVVERLRAAERIAGLAPARAADEVADVAFPGDLPAPLKAALEGATGKDRVQLVLASPEFQLV
jgi:uncharacterized protein (DUF1800 family)